MKKMLTVDKIKIRVDNQADRNELILIMANLGYKVSIERVKETVLIYRYYVVIDTTEKASNVEEIRVLLEVKHR